MPASQTTTLAVHLHGALYEHPPPHCKILLIATNAAIWLLAQRLSCGSVTSQYEQPSRYGKHHIYTNGMYDFQLTDLFIN